MLNLTDSSCLAGADGYPSIDFANMTACNDPGVWETIVKRYSRLIDDWGRKSGVAQSDLENLRQEVFARLARSINRFRPYHGERSFLAYLKTITRNQIVSDTRKTPPGIQCRSTNYETLLTIPQRSIHADTSELSKEKAALYEQVMELISENYSEQHVLIFTEYVIQQRQPRDIANELGVSTNVIYQVRSRILNYLRLKFASSTHPTMRSL